MDHDNIWALPPRNLISRGDVRGLGEVEREILASKPPRPQSSPSHYSGPKLPQKPTQTENVPKRVKCTWAGPIDPQLFGDSLKQLSKNTERNLSRLQQKRNELKTVSKEHRMLGEPIETSTADKPWHDTRVMFASWSELDKSSRASSIADDASSVCSTTSNVAHTFCYLCTTLEEHQAHMLRMRVPKKKVVRKPRVVYKAPMPKVKRKVEEPKEYFEWRYKIVVWTGDVAGATKTNGVNVFISLKGDMNFLYKTKLSNEKATFGRGAK